ncbi:MAG: hypothetical protein VW270_25000 [Candidatus Poseidoniales archaeon]
MKLQTVIDYCSYHEKDWAYTRLANCLPRYFQDVENVSEFFVDGKIGALKMIVSAPHMGRKTFNCFMFVLEELNYDWKTGKKLEVKGKK